MNPIECYKTYLSVKNHFSKESYDFFKYKGKTRVSEKTFYSKKERFWFEKLSRNKNDNEVVNFFVSNYSSVDDPSSLWIGDIIKNGEVRYSEWIEKKHNLLDIFLSECGHITKENFDDYFRVVGSRHPQILKDHLKGDVCIETLIIFDSILNYKKDFDSKLIDPIWEMVSLRMKKYSVFLQINTIKFRKALKEIIL